MFIAIIIDAYSRTRGAYNPEEHKERFKEVVSSWNDKKALVEGWESFLFWVKNKGKSLEETEILRELRNISVLENPDVTMNELQEYLSMWKLMK